MRSLLIEFHRFKNLSVGMLREGDDYLVAAAAHPVREARMTLDQAPFLDAMRDLRYQTGAEARKASLKAISDVVTGLLGDEVIADLKAGDFPLQLDLVVNAAELAALPFEAVTDAEGPLLVRGERCVELTRRVRNDFAETAVRWPSRPRVLYVWASPPGVKDVPHEHHEKALRAALKPWLPAGGEGDDGAVLAVLPKASLSSLREACAKAAGKKPFTHVHILAHGYPIGHAHRQRFGLALHAEDGELAAVSPEDFTAALAPLRREPVVVTLATCDAASMMNAMVPEKSIAHELHVSGFPVVLASQLPLTILGSNLMVERFYGELLAGKDVRMALHAARIALYESRERTGHDWASLVGYARLPEGYGEYLQAVRLEAIMASLRIARDRSVQPVESAGSHVAQLDEIAELLRVHILALETYLKEMDPQAREAVLLENLGLLGSAHKRLAELLFARGKLDPGGDGQALMRGALETARGWYRKGYERNLSHHWTGAQYLSLDSLLDGKIRNPGHWYAAVAAAEIQAKDPKEFWAHGSLAELYLLAPLAGQPANLEAAAAALEAMKDRVVRCNGDDRFPLDSTECQLRRYRDWWTAANGFFPGAADLAAEAGRLVEVLRAPPVALPPLLG